MSETLQVCRRPEEGKWFEVNPQAINQELFQEKRSDKRQEQTRQLILKAFTEVKYNSKKYGRPFITMMPEKKWNDSKVVSELIEFASKLGDHMADWVEQALEWAQRIHNGESWEDVCNKSDTANWYRLIMLNSYYARLIGDSVKGCLDLNYSASHVHDIIYSPSVRISNTVPLVVSYK